MVDVQQDRMQIFEEKLQKKEFGECIETAEKLLESLKTMSLEDSAKIRIACYTAIGDAYMGLKKFAEAMQSFEQARKVAEDKYGLLAEEAMLPIFRLEKALRALTSLEGGHDARSILTSSVLLSAQSSEAAQKLETGKHARTLQGLWAVALDKQIVRASNPFKALFDFAVQKLTSSKAEEFLARTSIVVSSIGLCGMIVYGVFWGLTHPYFSFQNKIVHGDFHQVNQARCKSKSQKWMFKPLDNSISLAWAQDGNADLSGARSAKNLNTVVYDGSPGSLASVFFTVFSKSNLLLRWNGYAMQDQYSTTYYDIVEPEEAVATKMYALRNSTVDFVNKHGRFPTSSERGDLSYNNPFTKKQERIFAFNAKENVADLAAACKAQGLGAGHPGLMVCVSPGPKRYYIGAFDRAKNPILTANANGFLVLGGKTPSPELPNDISGVVVFDKPVDQVSYLICAHTAFTWVLVSLLFGIIGPVLFLASRNWRNATRKVRPAARVGA